jgi:hypothetical protein
MRTLYPSIGDIIKLSNNSFIGLVIHVEIVDPSCGYLEDGGDDRFYFINLWTGRQDTIRRKYLFEWELLA